MSAQLVQAGGPLSRTAQICRAQIQTQIAQTKSNKSSWRHDKLEHPLCLAVFKKRATTTYSDEIFEEIDDSALGRDPVTMLHHNREDFPHFPSQPQLPKSPMSLSLVLQSVSHMSAALVVSEARTVVQCGHICGVARRAQACTTRCACHSSSSVLPSIPAPRTAAPSHGLICTIKTRIQPRWTPSQVTVVRREMQDHSQCFTPPGTCCQHLGVCGVSFS